MGSRATSGCSAATTAIPHGAADQQAASSRASRRVIANESASETSMISSQMSDRS
jgi:hypothetical protein